MMLRVFRAIAVCTHLVCLFEASLRSCIVALLHCFSCVRVVAVMTFPPALSTTLWLSARGNGRCKPSSSVVRAALLLSWDGALCIRWR